jgi:peptidyl-tRNA hydrolase, PTH2 family
MAEEKIRYLRQAIVIRKDLSMPAGKIGAMAAHAAMTFICKALKKCGLPEATDGSIRVEGVFTADEWQWITELDPGLEEFGQLSFGKIVLAVENEEELLDVYHNAVNADLCVHKVIDSGHSHNKFGDLAAIAIGPAWPEDLALVTGHLKVYRGGDKKGKDNDR